MCVSPQIMLQLEKSDLGCGAGGGQNNIAVFRMAGLTFLTNANADDSEEAGTFLWPRHGTVDFLKYSVVILSYYVGTQGNAYTNDF